MAAQLVLALLALAYLSAAVEPDCKDLIEPLVLDNRQPFYGKWIYHAGTSDNEDTLTMLKTITSSWIDLSPTSDSAVVKMRWGDRANGTCHLGEANCTFTRDTVQVTFVVNDYSSDHVGKYLKTCPDCLLYTDTSNVNSYGTTKQTKFLLFYTKTGNLEASQLEEFKKQAACLNYPLEIAFRENTNLCPDDQEVPSQ